MRFGKVENPTFVISNCGGVWLIFRVLDPKRTKFGPQEIISIFVEYAQNSKAYRFLDLQSNVTVESRDAEFSKNKLSKDIVEHSNHTIENQSLSQKDTPESSKRHYDAPIEPRRSQRMHKEKSLENEFISSQALVFLIEGDRTSVTQNIPIVFMWNKRIQRSSVKLWLLGTLVFGKGQ